MLLFFYKQFEVLCCKKKNIKLRLYSSAIKLLKFRVNSTKRRFMMDHCSNLLLFCETSISKNGNDPLTSFLLVNFILAYFVFNYSLKFLRW